MEGQLRTAAVQSASGPRSSKSSGIYLQAAAPTAESAGPTVQHDALLRRAHGLARLGAEWDELAVRQANPFMRRDWLTAWWSAFGRGREAVLCIARRNGKLVAGMPLSSGRRGLATLANDHTPS
jgi:CelD/BcsL family acetyltransferase involved in cellulose biosynthesis